MRKISIRPSAWLISMLFMCTGLPASADAPPPPPLYPEFPSETPATFQPLMGSFDYERREVMIAMRDGVKLHTVILVPKGARSPPILLTRTPYDADELTSHHKSSHLGPMAPTMRCSTWTSINSNSSMTPADTPQATASSARSPG